MNNNNSQLTLKILISFILLGIVAILFLFFYKFLTAQDSPKKISSEYKKIIIENDIAKDSAFKTETSKKDSVDNINASSKILKTALLKRAEVIGYSEETINTEFVEIDKQITNKNYAQSLDLAKKSIININTTTETYKRSHEEDFKKIEVSVKSYLDRGAILVNIRISDPWAIATIVPIKFETNPANILFKKSAGEWVRVAGPASFLDKKKLEASGVPQEIIKNMSIKLPENTLEQIKL